MPKNKDVEEKKKLHEMTKVADWLRNVWGLDDDECYPTSDVVECVEGAVAHFEKQSVEEYKKELILDLKKMKDDSGFGISRNLFLEDMIEYVDRQA